MKQLWIVNHHAGRPGEPGVRHFALARELQKHGWETSIFACSAQHNLGLQRIRGWRTRMTETIDGVHFRWLRMPAYRRNGVLRVLGMVGFFFRMILPGATTGLRPPDAVIGSTVHPLASLAGKMLARRHRVPFHFEIRDLWPETLIQMGALERDGIVAGAMRALERHLCNSAATVITTMPFANEYLEAQGIPRQKVVWISNGVKVSDFDPSPHGLSDSFRFVYFGALGRANHLSNLIEGFAQIEPSKRATFTLVGEGPLRQELEGLVQTLRAEEAIRVEPPVPKSEIPLLAHESDCLVVGLVPIPLYEYGISLNKLFEYMAAGRPIIFSGQAKGNPIELSGGGICVGSSARDINTAMERIVDLGPDDRRAMGARNRAYAERHFDFDVLAEKLAETLGPLT